MSAEDEMIAKITLHRDIKELVMRELRRAGVECEETVFTDSSGDIVILNVADTERAKQIIRELQNRANR